MTGEQDHPMSWIRMNPSDPVAGDSVVFIVRESAVPTSGIETYEWKISKRGSLFGPWTTVRFTEPGPRRVKLVLTGEDGQTYSMTRTVNINQDTEVGPTRIPRPPEASFTSSPSTPKVNESVTLDATESSDPDGRISSYSWEIESIGSRSGSITTVSFDEAGSKSVRLSVTDSDGLLSSEKKSIQVAPEAIPQPPEAEFSVTPANPEIGQQVTFDASDTTATDGKIASYEWQIQGVGSPVGQTTTGSFDVPGSKSVELTVTDDNGLSDSEVTTIDVERRAEPPQPAFSITPRNPEVGESVTLDASVSTDPDDQITIYQWQVPGKERLTGKSVEITFETAYTRDITLTVYDSRYNKYTTQKEVDVQEQNEPPEPSFKIDPESPAEDDNITLNATASSDPDGTIRLYDWEIRDAFNDKIRDLSGPKPVVDLPSGQYQVTLEVQDDDGAVSVKTKNTTVRRSSPIEAVVVANLNQLLTDSIFDGRSQGLNSFADLCINSEDLVPGAQLCTPVPYPEPEVDPSFELCSGNTSVPGPDEICFSTSFLRSPPECKDIELPNMLFVASYVVSTTDVLEDIGDTILPDVDLDPTLPEELPTGLIDPSGAVGAWWGYGVDECLYSGTIPERQCSRVACLEDIVEPSPGPGPVIDPDQLIDDLRDVAEGHQNSYSDEIVYRVAETTSTEGALKTAGAAAGTTVGIYGAARFAAAASGYGGGGGGTPLSAPYKTTASSPVPADIESSDVDDYLQTVGLTIPDNVEGLANMIEVFTGQNI